MIPEELWARAPFDRLDETGRRGFEEAAELRRFSAEEVIYEAGGDSKGMYIIASGQISLFDRVMATLSGDAEVIIDQRGALVSRGSLLDAFQHRHDCVARTDCELLFLSREAFETAFEANEPFALRLVDYLVQRGSDDVRAFNQAIHGTLSQS